MAIPLMEEDVEIISKLGDTPGSDDGLTAQQLKGRFDLAGVRIKNFINNTLIPHMNQLVDVQSLLNGILDTTLSKSDKAANSKAVGDKIAEVQRTANAALPAAGGRMAGTLNMNNQQLTGLPMPVSATNAVPKSYVDTATVPIKLSATGWVGSKAPYYQTVNVTGMDDSKIVRGHPVYTGTYEEDLEIQEACSCVSYAERTGSTAKFWCLTSKPKRDISVNVEVGV